LSQIDFFVGKADIKLENNKFIVTLGKKTKNSDLFIKKTKEILGIDIELKYAFA
jgi:hypothetical protein